ncbi:uncharacterized protein LOC129569884 [Sitodiplosis mosellana]|uniref:uncharacterized protein LOC129569884 n=1 Tax=Sitodiplosis mosellana TaxID=263140 RepID=UPI0024450AA9|nr:uncharacterized protein LOC129569884 [Sitodiplosis mosellana]
MDNENAHIQIAFGDKNCTAYEDGIVLNFTTNEGNIKSFACVYPLRWENGGDIHFIGDTEWITIDADPSDFAPNNKYDINLSTASFFAIAYVLGFNDYNENGALLPLDYYQKKEDAENYIRKLCRKPSGERKN